MSSSLITRCLIGPRPSNRCCAEIQRESVPKREAMIKYGKSTRYLITAGFKPSARWIKTLLRQGPSPSLDAPVTEEDSLPSYLPL
ncbi:hypothetical protein RRG08_044742 [Elysia crispata]|uniref:Uncharacterized protein n=1 Tax=Elysia crispata TaxID=231223 RepID=A0AAE1DGD6_9GAST|nr:hypothetical protein RRG08_044742 [Elysia crispata]